MFGCWEGARIGRIFRINRILRRIFVLIMLIFPQRERSRTCHLFKLLTDCIMNRARLTLTMALFPWGTGCQGIRVLCLLLYSGCPHRGTTSRYV